MILKFYLIILFIITTNLSFSQLNIVPNSSFETADSSFLKGDCGWFDSIVVNWFTPEHIDGHVGSADYWSNKSTIPWMKPYEQYPFSGDAYVGIVLIGSVLDFDYRENIETKFKVPLKNDLLYNVKVHYVYSESTIEFDSVYALGLHFSDTLIYRNFDSINMYFFPLTLKPQLVIEIKKPIESINWKTEEFTYIAKGGEQYLTIGSFGEVGKLPYNIYLYLDDISVIPIYPANAGDNKKLCKGDSILIGDNNYTEYEYSWLKKGSADTLSHQGQFWVKPDTATTYILHQYYESKYFSADSVVVDVSYSYCHKENSLIVFPNPSAGDFLFQMKNPINSDVSIEIFDILGRKVKESKFASGSYQTDYPLNMTGIGSGAYIYRLKYNEGSFSGRLMVVRN